MNKPLILLCASVFTLGSASSATAASSAQATIDWNNLSFQLFDFSGGLNVPTLRWNSGSGSVLSMASTLNGLDYDSASRSSSGFNRAITAESSSEYSAGLATRNNSLLSALASSSSSVATGLLPDTNRANANATNTGSFELTGNGLLLIAMDWLVTTSARDYPDHASASINISGNYSSAFNSGSSVSNYYTPYDTQPVNQSGTFTMAVFNTGYGITFGSISATAGAESYSETIAANVGGGFELTGPGSGSSGNTWVIFPPQYPDFQVVPVPGALWLFGSAMFGFIWQRKRKTFLAV